MIDFLDNTLRHLFVKSQVITNGDTQVGFEPPSDDWRNSVKNLTVNGEPANALNVYLADLRENRVLRSNERSRDLQNGVITETPAPRRVDCHYLISAWSPAAASDTVEPTVEEHALLYKATAALMNAEPFVPRQIYSPDPQPAGFPSVIWDSQLPSVVLPPEGFPKLAEFWGATKTVHWKPTIYLIVTLPVIMPSTVAGPMVTTRITEYRMSGSSRTEMSIQIGGTILSGTPPQPVNGAWVELQDNTGKPISSTTTDTDGDGHFTFGGLQEGDYALRVRAQGFKEAIAKIHVPATSGNYDVQLS